VRFGTVSINQVTYGFIAFCWTVTGCSRSVCRVILSYLNCLLGDYSLTELSKLVPLNVSELSQDLAGLYAGWFTLSELSIRWLESSETGCIEYDFVVPVNILTSFAHAPFSWAARHTTVCIDHGLSCCFTRVFANQKPVKLSGKTCSHCL